MHPPMRTQDKPKADMVRELTKIWPEGESLTRQEFAAEQDTAYILARFGLNTMVRQDAQHVEIDMNQDLQQSYMQLEQLRGAVENLPGNLQEKYQNPNDLLRGVQSGELHRDLEEHRATQEKQDRADKRARARAEAEEAEKEAPAKPPEPPKQTPAAKEPGVS